MSREEVMRHYRTVVRAEEVPLEETRKLFGDLLQALGFQIVREATPDYVSFELRRVMVDK
jgi:hypothetical protein